MANFVMSLAGDASSGSVVELSGSPFCHYHYSNLTKVLRYWQIKDKDFRVFIRSWLPSCRFLEDGTPYYAFTHDFTKLLKGHSPCLEDRQYVPVCNNVISSNRSLGVGYPLAALHLGIGDQGWCPPLALQRIDSAGDANSVALEQVRTVLRDPMLPFWDQLCLLRADTSYGKAVFLSPLYELDNLVGIARLRAGMKVWSQAPDADPTGGARRIYGEQYYLSDTSAWKTYHRKGTKYEVWQTALGEQRADEELKVEDELKNGRKVTIDIRRWKNLLIRTKDGASMKDKPLDVLRIAVLDAQSQKPVFDRPMFIAVSGKRKNEIDPDTARKQYRERYDVEPYYNFAKNRLLMDKLQTPDVRHLDTWLHIVQITSWLLFTARQEIGQINCPVWQKYMPQNKTAQQQPLKTLTIAQTQRAVKSLFCTLDPTPFLPLKCKKGKGRLKGQTFPKRTRFKVVKKIKKSRRKLKNQQNE